MQPKTVRLSYSLSLSVHPDFISQDYRFGFLSTIKHNSSLLIGAFFLIPFHRERLQWPPNGRAPAPPGAQELGSASFQGICLAKPVKRVSGPVSSASGHGMKRRFTRSTSPMAQRHASAHSTRSPLFVKWDRICKYYGVFEWCFRQAQSDADTSIT